MKNIFLFFFILIFISCKENSKDGSELFSEAEFKKLEFQIDSLKSENASLRDLSKQKEKTTPWFDSIYDGKALLKRNITNPSEFIKESLQSKPELIPSKAVLGGTMYFSKIEPLGSKWIIAQFEDGHIQGRAIYKYRLKDDGELEFQLLDATESE